MLPKDDGLTMESLFHHNSHPAKVRDDNQSQGQYQKQRALTMPQPLIGNIHTVMSIRGYVCCHEVRASFQTVLVIVETGYNILCLLF